MIFAPNHAERCVRFIPYQPNFALNLVAGFAYASHQTNLQHRRRRHRYRY